MRRSLLVAAGLMIVLAAGAAAVWLWRESRTRVSTENAAVEAAVVVVSAQVAGPVARVLVQDHETVRPDQLLVQIDPRDLAIAVEQARARVAMAEAAMRGARAEVPLSRDTSRGRIQQMRAGVEAARMAVAADAAQIDEAQARLEARRAAVAAARADVAVAEAAAERARLDLDRLSRLVAAELVSRQEHDTARTAHTAATAAVEATRRRLAQAERAADEVQAEIRRRRLAVEQAERRAEEAEGQLTQATSQEAEVPVKEAEVGRTEAALQQARVDLEAAERELAKTRITAPASGSVAKKSVEPGQLVQVGQPLLALVPLEAVWVVANFKETQLTRVRPGLRAMVTVDTFPDRVFQGRVEAVGAGTGSRFSLLPAENATGNWVKVVQRVPVKVVLEDYRPNPHYLRPGMSASVTIHLDPPER